MIDRNIAEHIYKVAADEIAAFGSNRWQTISLMKAAVEKVGKDYSDFFYSEGNRLFLKMEKWQRFFLDEGATGEYKPLSEVTRPYEYKKTAVQEKESMIIPIPAGDLFPLFKNTRRTDINVTTN